MTLPGRRKTHFKYRNICRKFLQNYEIVANINKTHQLVHSRKIITVKLVHKYSHSHIMFCNNSKFSQLQSKPLIEWNFSVWCLLKIKSISSRKQPWKIGKLILFSGLLSENDAIWRFVHDGRMKTYVPSTKRSTALYDSIFQVFGLFTNYGSGLTRLIWLWSFLHSRLFLHFYYSSGWNIS